MVDGINPVAGFVAGLGMAVEDEQTYTQRLEQNDALRVLSDEIKIKRQLEADERSAAQGRRSAWDQTNQELGVQIAAMSSIVVSVLSDRDLKTSDEVDLAAKPYYDRMARLLEDDAYKTSDFQTMIHSAASIVDATIKQKKEDIQATLDLKTTFDQLLTIQAGEGIIQSGENKGKPSGKYTGDFSSSVTEDGVASLLEATSNMREVFSGRKDDAAIKVLDLMEERGRKILYVEQRLRDFDFKPGQGVDAGVQFDPDYRDPDTGLPYGPNIIKQVRAAEDFLKAGLWEQAYITMSGVEQNLKEDRAEIGTAIATRNIAMNDLLLNQFKGEQNKLKIATDGTRMGEALDGLGLVNVISRPTDKGWSDEITFQDYEADISILRDMMRLGIGGVGENNLLQFTDIAEQAEVLGVEGRDYYLAGWIKRVGETNEFVWNSKGTPAYTDKSGKPLERGDWGDNPYIMYTLSNRMVRESRRKLVDDFDNLEVVKNGKKLEMNKNEKSIMVNFYGDLIEGYYNHPLNTTVTKRTKNAKDPLDKIKAAAGMIGVRHRQKLMSGVDTIQDIMVEESTQANKTARIKEWTKISIENGLFTEAEVGEVIKLWIEEYGLEEEDE